MTFARVALIGYKVAMLSNECHGCSLSYVACKRIPGCGIGDLTVLSDASSDTWWFLLKIAKVTAHRIVLKKAGI